jgi:hypothetical protein
MGSLVALPHLHHCYYAKKVLVIADRERSPHDRSMPVFLHKQQVPTRMSRVKVIPLEIGGG